MLVVGVSNSVKLSEINGVSLDETPARYAHHDSKSSNVHALLRQIYWGESCPYLSQKWKQSTESLYDRFFFKVIYLVIIGL